MASGRGEMVAPGWPSVQWKAPTSWGVSHKDFKDLDESQACQQEGLQPLPGLL